MSQSSKLVLPRSCERFLSCLNGVSLYSTACAASLVVWCVKDNISTKLCASEFSCLLSVYLTSVLYIHLVVLINVTGFVVTQMISSL